MITILDYMEYRTFLRDYYLWKKKNNPWFSYRYIAQKVQMDASHLSKIYMGKRHIANKDTEKFIAICELRSKEAKYFQALVRFNKAKTDSDIKKYFEEIMSFKDIKKYTLEKGQYEFYAKWYHSAILTLLHIYPFSGDYETLGSMLWPPLTASEVKNSVKLLQELDLVEKDHNGVFVLKNRFVTSGEESHRSISVRKYQEETIRLAAESLNRHPREKRNISTVTITIDQDHLDRINEMIIQFRTELLKMAKETENPDSVYQLNVQLFPLTKAIRRVSGEES